MRHLITAACIAAALGAYYFGLATGSGMFLIAAAVVEIVTFKWLSRRPGY